MKPSEWVSLAAMAVLFLLPQIFALAAVNPFEDAGVQAFEDPDDPANILQVVAVVIVFTLIILLAARYTEHIVKYILLFFFFLSIFYILQAFFLIAIPSLSELLALTVAVGAIALLIVHPEWYVIDAIGVLIASGIIAIFGLSMSIPLIIALLAILAAYDAISVYKTRHMLSLADTVIGESLPLLMVVPKTRQYSFIKETGLQDERDAMFMGLGDIIIPGMLAAGAYAAGSFGVAAGAIIGSFAGFLLLMTLVMRGNPQAGLPALNGGAIAGYALTSWVLHGSLLGF